MTVFGAMGFILFSPTIYLALAGGLIGVGVGRIIGSKFKTRMKYRNLDQRMLFEMELIMKWVKVQRKGKKQKLDDV
jgi:hypothetical protein